MNAKIYKNINRILGLIIGLLACTVYIITAEPSASWWDCGEYISTTYKMLVGHPPGAPTFQIIGRFFSLFAGNDVTQVAHCINIMSAICSGLSIMFLFWTITLLGRKLVEKIGGMTTSRAIALFGSALVGSLAYTFSDTFWFSAVEGEVYGMSSFFTALVFWCVLKWDYEYDHRIEGVNPSRWLVLIAYLVGLSIGVHLLSLLVLPAIVLVIYFKLSKKATYMGVVLTLAFVSIFAGIFFSIGMMLLIWLFVSAPLFYTCIKKGTLKEKAEWGVVFSLLGSFFLLAIILFGIIPGIVNFAGKFEIFFVNYIHLPFNSGTIIYFLIIIALITWGLRYSIKKKKEIFFATIFGFIFILIGYSTFVTLVIRSNANPTIDENSPDNAVALLSYLNREQYGSTPIFYGPAYNSRYLRSEDGTPSYAANKKLGKYVVVDNAKGTIPTFKENMFFPRMYKSEKAENYKSWLKKYYNPQNPEDKEVLKIIEKNRFPNRDMNIKFLQTYQLNYMYFRYFMWNFAGKQNDIQGFGDSYNGNWVTGIPFIDNLLVGRQDHLPLSMERPGHNTYYLLPLLLGIIGLIYYSRKDLKNSFIVLLLFAMTGLAISLFLNMGAFEPRERDYAFAASFYAFAIWIGFGVFAIYSLFEKIKSKYVQAGAASLVTVITILAVPTIMAKENWDDHNRANRYTAMAIAKNYLDSCAPNAILFTLGDNDTFPLWYVQEVEGFRTDVRVCNLSLLGASWYVDQMKRKAYNSDPLPISMTWDQYKEGNRNAIYFDKGANQFVDIQNVMKIIKSKEYDNQRNLIFADKRGGSRNIPGSFSLTVDKEKVLASGTVKPEDENLIVDKIKWNVDRDFYSKAYIVMLDILANNNWERPIYYSSTVGPEGWFGLENYFQNEGFAYRLVPINTPRNAYAGIGRVDTKILYDNVMNKYADGSRIDKINNPNAIKKTPAKYYWGGFNDPRVYHPEENVRVMTTLIRETYRSLAEELIKEGQYQKAEEVLDMGNKVLPDNIFPYRRTYHSDYTLRCIIYIRTYLACETPSAREKAKKMLSALMNHFKEEFIWYEHCNDRTLQIQKENIDDACTRLMAITQLINNDFIQENEDLWKDIHFGKIANNNMIIAMDKINSKLNTLEDIQGIVDNLYQISFIVKISKLSGDKEIEEAGKDFINNTIKNIEQKVPQYGPQLRSMFLL